MNDPFNARSSLQTSSGKYEYYKLTALADEKKLSSLPYTIRVLLEAALRNLDDFSITKEDVQKILDWDPGVVSDEELAFNPGRVILQDFTGVPAVVDLAALRSAMVRMGGDPAKINPGVQVDLVIDHSVQVDHYGSSDALAKNIQKEFERNAERYEFLKWGQQAFENFQIVPPGIGIVHQVNLEYLANVALVRDGVVFPDSLVGTDSHTTMINGLGVLGWGVGGIEAEAVMLGQPVYMLIPQVVGFELTGNMTEGVTATDLVLKIVEMLREKGVVGKFVEFYGAGLKNMSLPDRATIANMAPEYGATCGFFPVDAETLNYLRKTGRSESQIELVEKYYKAQGLFHDENSPRAVFSDTLELDISSVVPALSGPKRPQDRIDLKDMKSEWASILKRPVKERGFALDAAAISKSTAINAGYKAQITHGNIVIAAITSCTNTSNPGVMLGAGLLAKKAVQKGLTTKPFVKTSLAPGSRVVSDYLDKANLTESLNKLGFNTVGYGCTTCIGNSGPVPEAVVEAINAGNLVATSVLSGNRNFEGRISPDVKANFLASPPLVVAYAIAGTVDIDILNEPLGKGSDGSDVYLKDIWPTNDEIKKAVEASITPAMYQQRYGNLDAGNPLWTQIPLSGGKVYEWKASSTYIQEPDFFKDMSMDLPDLADIVDARCLVKVGDSVTTDHISPAGAIPDDMPAAIYLKDKGVPRAEFNSFGSRRGNDQVMTRGTFGNIRLRNQMAPGTEGGWTRLQPDDKQMTIFDASMEYQKNKVPLVILAGSEYGTGSSRDWAAKGTFTLGVKAVIATSYERIHRSNLVGMGVLPLQFLNNQTHESLGLTGKESFSIIGLSNQLKPMQNLKVVASDSSGKKNEFEVQCRLDTPVEIEYYKNGGILHTVLRNFLKK